MDTYDPNIDLDPAADSNQQEPLPQPIFIARKGRGAVSNLQGRYETQLRNEIDDGWYRDDVDDEDSDTPALRTHVTEEYAKSILSRNQSPDLPFNVSLNPYRVITPKI